MFTSDLKAFAEVQDVLPQQVRDVPALAGTIHLDRRPPGARRGEVRRGHVALQPPSARASVAVPIDGDEFPGARQS